MRAMRVVAAVVLGIAALASPATAQNIQDIPNALNIEAADTLADEIIQDLEASQRVREAGIERLAVYGFDQDPTGVVSDQVFVALSGLRFQVMERESLERVMREHNFHEDLSDLVDSDSLVEVGQWLGVEAILFGEIRVDEFEDEQLFRDLLCWVIDLRTGERLWSASRSGRFGDAPAPPPPPPPPPPPWYTQPLPISLALVGLLVLVWLVVTMRAPASARLAETHAKKQERLNADRQLRNRMVRTLAGAQDNLAQARDHAHRAQRAEVVETLRTAESDLRALSDTIGSASSGDSIFFSRDTVATRHLDQMLDFERTLESGLRDVVNLCAECRTGAESDPAGVKTDTLRDRVTRLRQRFQERQDYLSGMEE